MFFFRWGLSWNSQSTLVINLESLYKGKGQVKKDPKNNKKYINEYINMKKI